MSNNFNSNNNKKEYVPYELDSTEASPFVHYDKNNSVVRTVNCGLFFDPNANKNQIHKYTGQQTQGYDFVTEKDGIKVFSFLARGHVSQDTCDALGLKDSNDNVFYKVSTFINNSEDEQRVQELIEKLIQGSVPSEDPRYAGSFQSIVPVVVSGIVNGVFQKTNDQGKTFTTLNIGSAKTSVIFVPQKAKNLLITDEEFHSRNVNTAVQETTYSNTQQTPQYTPNNYSANQNISTNKSTQNTSQYSSNANTFNQAPVNQQGKTFGNSFGNSFGTGFKNNGRNTGGRQ